MSAERASAALKRIVERYGRHITDDVRRVENALKDLCPQSRREIFALCLALREGIASELVHSRSGIPLAVVAPRLAGRLESASGLSLALCQWAVASWATVLEICDEPETLTALEASQQFETPLPPPRPFPETTPLVPAPTHITPRQPLPPPLPPPRTSQAAPKQPVTRRSYIFMLFVSTAAVLVALLLAVGAVLWSDNGFETLSNLFQKLPATGESGSTPTAIEKTARQAQAAADRVRKEWESISASLPEPLWPAEVGSAEAQWKAGEAALAAGDYSAAQAAYNAAQPLFTAAVAAGQNTSRLHVAAQVQMDQLTAKRRQWQDLAGGTPAGSLPATASQAEAVYQTAVEGMQQADTLASVPTRVTQALNLYGEAISALRKQQADLAAAEARRKELEEIAHRSFENSLKMKFVFIPPGEFDMGSPESENRREPDEKLHRVRLTKGVYLAAHEVSVGSFREFVRLSKYKTEAETDSKGGWGWNSGRQSLEQKPEYSWRNPGFPQGDEHPVVNVSWNDAVAFCNWLSEHEKLTPCYRYDAKLGWQTVPGAKGYRLPTEAEWEYACRAGTKTAHVGGDNLETLARFGNVPDGDAKARIAALAETLVARDGFVFTAPAGRFAPNAWGLFDMHGNVMEWCQDWSAEYSSDPVDPPGPASGAYRITRGGSWYGEPIECRSAYRNPRIPTYRDANYGFRVVCVK